jgi:hypothetical protein
MGDKEQTPRTAGALPEWEEKRKEGCNLRGLEENSLLVVSANRVVWTYSISSTVSALCCVFHLGVILSMNLTEREQKVLDCICIRGGGVDIHEAMDATGLDYSTLVRTVYELISKGYEIRALSIGKRLRGGDGWIKRLFLSPYDRRHKELIKN